MGMCDRTRVGWMKWRGASSILCGVLISCRPKEKFYKTRARPAILYGSKC